MKSILTFTIILLLGSLCHTLAQADLSYTHMADTLLYPLNKSYITTGINTVVVHESNYIIQ